MECNGLPSGDLGSLKDLVNWGKALPLSYGGLTEGGIKPLYGTPASWDQYGKYKMWVEYQGSWRKNSRLTKSDCLLLTKENIYRLFNGDFRTNGRFYGPAHQQPSEKARENLFIDGEETGERDYAGMLLGLALNKMGVSYNGDPYYRITGGDELLKEVYKKVGYRVLCSVDKVGKSGRSTTARNRAIGSLNQERINKKLKMPKGLTSDKAIDEFIKAYPEIEPLLFRGKGLELNFIDSWIMSNVIKRLLSQNIFPLTVHDSVIAQKKYLGEVEKVMDEEYEKVMYVWTGQRFKPVIK
ncbi:hypothetical protein GTO36_01675 [bacterium]|nr:hypothetical protein [bacterium]